MKEQRTINSSNISKAAYDDEIQTLYVEFSNGTRYKYVDIPRQAFENLYSCPKPSGYLKKLAIFYKGEKY